MRVLLAAFLSVALAAKVSAIEADFDSLPASQRAILRNTSFELRVLSPTALFPPGESPSDLSNEGFLLFICAAKKTLGKRLLWIDAEVEFSNGYTRKFNSVSLQLLTGTAVAVAKLDFPTLPDLTARKLKITSAPTK